MIGPIDVTGSPHARLRPVADASIDDGFWADRQRLNRDVLLPGGARAARARPATSTTCAPPPA